MNCPKCGYEQQERLDCLRCGIVFSKYLALFPRGKPGSAEAAEPGTRGSASDDLPGPELVQLSQQMREISRRFNELEFERAERARLRDEMRVLEAEIRGKLAELAARLGALEARAVPAPAAPAQPDLEPLISRIELVEVALKTPPAAKAGAKVMKSLAEINERIAELETRGSVGAELAGEHGFATSSELEGFVGELGTLQSMVDEVRERLEGAGKDFDEIRRTLLILQSDVAALREPAADPFPKLDHLSAELERLRTSVLNVTTRYADFTELKKSHAALSASVAALTHEIGSARARSAGDQ
jgi:chromosome segregation ATPase